MKERSPLFDRSFERGRPHDTDVLVGTFKKASSTDSSKYGSFVLSEGFGGTNQTASHGVAVVRTKALMENCVFQARPSVGIRRSAIAKTTVGLLVIIIVLVGATGTLLFTSQSTTRSVTSTTTATITM